jgi:hypothetical protein
MILSSRLMILKRATKQESSEEEEKQKKISFVFIWIIGRTVLDFPESSQLVMWFKAFNIFYLLVP